MRETTVTLCYSNTVRQSMPVFRRLMDRVQFASPVLYTIEDIIDRVEQGKMQMWYFAEPGCEPHLCAVTLVEVFPQGNIAHVILAAGSRIRSMVAWTPRFEQWCREVGAMYVHFECGAKLLKVMQRMGYVATGYAVYKPLYVAN